jgi:hypothetical protein
MKRIELTNKLYFDGNRTGKHSKLFASKPLAHLECNTRLMVSNLIVDAENIIFDYAIKCGYEIKGINYDDESIRYLEKYLCEEFIPYFSKLAKCTYNPKYPPTVNDKLINCLEIEKARQIRFKLYQFSLFADHCIACTFNGRWEHGDGAKLFIDVPDIGLRSCNIYLDNFYELNSLLEYIHHLKDNMAISYKIMKDLDFDGETYNPIIILDDDQKNIKEIEIYDNFSTLIHTEKIKGKWSRFK